MAKPGFVDGRHYATYAEEVLRLKRAGDLDGAEALLLRLVDATEAETSAGAKAGGVRGTTSNLRSSTGRRRSQPTSSRYSSGTNDKQRPLGWFQTGWLSAWPACAPKPARAHDPDQLPSPLPRSTNSHVTDDEADQKQERPRTRATLLAVVRLCQR